MNAVVLLVEADAAIAEPLCGNLVSEGFDVVMARTVADAQTAFDRREPDFVVVDVVLPDGDGRDLCRVIGARSDVPIILITAPGKEIDRITGLECGADDYVVMPFSASELVARMRAVSRPSRSVERLGPIEIGALTLDQAAHIVTKDGEPIELSPKEFDLLAHLMGCAGSVDPREQIMAEVWDQQAFRSTKTLNVHVSWLRRKIEDDPKHPRYITTVRGVGFRFATPEEVAGTA